jgi:SAM-dependent methyltransferase
MGLLTGAASGFTPSGELEPDTRMEEHCRCGTDCRQCGAAPLESSSAYSKGADSVNRRAQELFFEAFEALPRQGPGNLDSTRRALALCRELPSSPHVLDLGSGGGAQTLHLASLLGGSILAIDSHPPLVARLRATVEERGLLGRIEARVGDMSSLDLPSETFDLVWSEGALYNLGLRTALSICAGLLRPGGYLAFTEPVWRTPDPPNEVLEAFADYPTMGTVEDVLSLIEVSSFSLVDHFDLPDEAWWNDFYGPLEQRIETLRAKYAEDVEALSALDEIAREPKMHRRSGHHYGYTFFVARRS